MQHGKADRQKGFTIHEMLVVVLIAIVLLAVSMVAVVGYMRRLRLAELDNAAKDIFFAAQNRAILLSGNQKLGSLVMQDSNRIDHVDVIPDAESTTQITIYYVHSQDENMDELLPVGTIDPTAAEGDFYITYEPESGSVIDVFYSDETLPVNGDFYSFYEKWRAADKTDRMNSDPMIGYYGGEAAESGTTVSLRTPVINIYNEDSLRAEVTYWVPRTLVTMGEAAHVRLDVTLTYQGAEVSLQDAAVTPAVAEDISNIGYTYVWVLDSLEEDEARFKELFSAPGTYLTCGDDFTITASVSYDGEMLKVNGARKSATDNSLFAKGSGEQTAYIACLRHLQNLDQNFSAVAGKNAAVQLGNIQAVEDYEFQPIQNEEIGSYDGQAFSIYGLNISEKPDGTGLFGQFSGRENAYKTLQNIRLVNAAAAADGSGPAGALVGAGEYLRLSNCMVYWENRSEQTTNLRDILGDSTRLNYQVTGSGPAGGLAGKLENALIQGCSASTLLKSADTAGGLVGQGSGLTIQNSYASSYLSGPAAAGLVGSLAGSAEISGSYAVGFIDSGTSGIAAGLCLGQGTAQATGSYSAMLFTAGDNVTNYPLCQKGIYERTYYLASDHFGFDRQYEKWARTYDVLTDPTQWDTLFGPGIFAAKSIVQSHPYNLQTTLSLTTFIYPGLESMDHWGDWGAQFQNGSLVYYEIYEGDAYGFSGGNLSHLSDDKTVVQDGYAVAYKSTDPISGIGATLQITYQTLAGSQTEDVAYVSGGANPIYQVKNVTDPSGGQDDYYLLPLPGRVVNTDYAADNFYQKITVQDSADETGATRDSYYYNPHFANTVIADGEGTEDELGAMADQLRVEVRTPRHLYMLSAFAQYYASSHQYRFLQQLDLDYHSYSGYGLFEGDWMQAPVGLDAASPFRGSYYGSHHIITGVVPAVQGGDGGVYQYVGLFGYSIGVLQDVAYQMEQDAVLVLSQSGSSSFTLYGGALVGHNGGTVHNCTAFGVRIQANGYQYSTIYLGGLVGQNRGIIQSSSVEGASISADASMSHAYVGGFVGENAVGGVIDQCYAVGKVSATQARYGTVYACGFAGRNHASLSRSYAAVYLLADGEVRRYGFCPDASTKCVYLNAGNFTYRRENYAAQYEDPSAMSVTWEALAGQAGDHPGEELAEQAKAVAALGMQSGAVVYGAGQNYPYPAVLTTEDGTAIHYGQWPEHMDLGAMGVYYWEELTIGKTVSYHISAVYMTMDQQVMKRDTLSTAHGDDGVVTQYGYGYFYQQSDQSMGIVLTSSGIGYGASASFAPQAGQENSQVNAALAALMSGQYVFHSYNTWGTADSDQGLYQVATSVYGEPPAGTWVLEQGVFKLAVRLNPFFADAMAHQSGGNPTADVPTALPGTEKNPYEVRAVEQLQFINWNVNQKKTTQRMDTWNKANYPYLSYGGTGTMAIRSFFWEQTHDLKGREGVTYTPIAEVYDQTSEQQGILFGWFGGTYDGNDYLIADVNIRGQSQSSCVGLFGAVFNATLKNIVMYSENGTATVEGNNSGDSRWYAIGGLAGLAGSSTGSSVVNCTVAGYTIKDTHQSTKAGGWGGTGLGGLIGVSDMSLSGCTAVTNIELNSKDNDNVRVGGLVGSCQGSISSCYSGGSIQIAAASATPYDRGIYIGGIVGGIYMKPLKVGGGSATVGQSGQSLQNTLKNCYTYTELPDVNSNPYIKGLYAVGGSGELNVYGSSDGNADHGYTNYDNNYYLRSVVLKNNGGTIGIDRNDLGRVMAMTYDQMADARTADGLLYRLDSNGAGFSTVTTTSAAGAPLSGRYSFGNDPGLLGLDYPFPTILTQSSDLVSGGKANVHYGDWPLAGIRRENGALPVDLDLFADYRVEDKGAVWTEVLALEGLTRNGSWSVASQDPDIVTAELRGNGTDARTLVLTGQKAGSTLVTVSYGASNGSSYMLDIEVNVTAELRLVAAAPSPVLMLTDERMATPLVLLDRNGRELGDLQEQIILSGFTAEYDPNYFVQAAVGQTDGLMLTAESGAASGNTQVMVGYDFTYLGNAYHATSSLAIQLAAPEITLKPVTFTFAKESTEQSQTQEYTGAGESALVVTIDGETAEIADLAITAYEEVPAAFQNMVFVEWAENGEGQEKALSVTAYAQKIYPAYASVRVQYQFTCAGSIHTIWKDLEIQIVQKAAGSADGDEGQP